MKLLELLFILFFLMNFFVLPAQEDSNAIQSKSIRNWEAKHEMKLIKNNVNIDSIAKARKEFDTNVLSMLHDSLSSKDVKKEYMVFYKDALAVKIDSIDSVIEHSNRIVYNATIYSNLVYSGLSISGETGFHPAFDNSLTFFSRSGFYCDAGVSFWKRIDSINFKYLGLGFSKTVSFFSYDLSYQRLLLQNGTTRDKNELKNCFDMNLNADLNWFNIGLDASYLFGLNQLLTTTANAEFCLRGTSLFQPLSSWKLGLQIIAYAATDEVFLKQPKVNKNPKSRKNNEKLTAYYGFAAIECSLPFTYTVKKFSTTIAANYALPQNNISGNRYIKKSEIPETNPNQFYMTLALSYNFLFHKKK